MPQRPSIPNGNEFWTKAAQHSLLFPRGRKIMIGTKLSFRTTAQQRFIHWTTNEFVCHQQFPLISQIKIAWAAQGIQYDSLKHGLTETVTEGKKWTAGFKKWPCALFRTIFWRHGFFEMRLKLPYLRTPSLQVSFKKVRRLRAIKKWKERRTDVTSHNAPFVPVNTTILWLQIKVTNWKKGTHV